MRRATSSAGSSTSEGGSDTRQGLLSPMGFANGSTQPVRCANTVVQRGTPWIENAA